SSGRARARPGPWPRPPPPTRWSGRSPPTRRNAGPALPCCRPASRPGRSWWRWPDQPLTTSHSRPDRLPDLSPGNQDHVDPRLLVVDRARRHQGQVLVVLGHRAHVVKRLLVGLARKYLPHGLVLAAHTTIPSRRIV